MCERGVGEVPIVLTYYFVLVRTRVMTSMPPVSAPYSM